MNIIYSPSALENLAALPGGVQNRVANKIEFYARQPNVHKFAKKLMDQKVYRFRIGDYRAICDISKDMIFVLAILKRDEAYKDL